MSANACVAFYGIRFEVAADDVEALESRSDWRMQAARKAGLKHYCDNFGLPGERYLLFVGTKLAVLGPENAAEAKFDSAELQGMIELTRRKLAAAGLNGEPALYLQWLPDA